MLRVASIMSHQSCRMYHVAYLVSHQPCRINHVAGTYDMCIHATHMTGDILRFIRCKTFLTEKSLTLRQCRNTHFSCHATLRKSKSKSKSGDIIKSHDCRPFSVSQNSTTNCTCGNYCQTQQRYLYRHMETE